MDELSIIEKALSGLPDAKKAELVVLVQEFAERARYQPPPLPDVCPPHKTYDVWKIENSSRDGVRCLLENWGDWLKAGNPKLDRDYMSQADLRKRDKKLMKRLENSLSVDEIASYIPKYSMINDQEAARISPEQYRAANRVRNIVRTRRL